MIDFNYTAPELLPFRIQEVLDAPNEPHRIGGVVYVPTCGKSGKESNYEKLFGSPERAARTLYSLCKNCEFDCSGCEVYEFTHGGKRDYDALLEWLRGDA